eukprot:7606806-Alexandrium_andersonii.AAC.1
MRHDGSPFAAEESWRAGKAGDELRYRCCLLHIRGDWAEFSERFGFPTASANERPCFCCGADSSNLYSP